MRITVLFLAVFVTVAVSQDSPQERMADAMKLTEHHKELGKFAGDWDVTLAIAGGPTMKGTAKASWLFEGRWMQLRVETPMFQAFVVMGYDKIKKSHVAMAVDSISPNMKTMTGPTVDKSGKVSVMYGEHDEYLTGELDKPIKYVTRWVNDDKWIFEVWDLGIGENGKAVVVETFTRKK